MEQSSWIIDCGLQLADSAPLSPEPADLDELIARAVEARNTAAGFSVQLELAGDLPLVRIDPVRGRALIENILMLFRFVAETNSVRLRTLAAPDSCPAQRVMLEIESAARGYRSEVGLGAGAALGLQSARKIAEAHGGSVDFEADPADGIRLRMMLP